MQSRAWGWGDPRTIVLLAGGVAALAALVPWELRRRAPLVELHLFGNRNFAGNTAVLACVQLALVALTVFGALWVQNVLGFVPIDAGLSLLPLTVPLLVVAPIAGRVYDRLGGRMLVTGGAAMVAAALAWSAIVLDQQSYAWLLPGYAAIGIGLGLIMTPANTDAMNSARADLRGQASGMVQMARNVGGTIGIAVSGTVVAHVLVSRLTEIVDADPRVGPNELSQLERALSEQGSGQAEALGQLPTAAVADAREAFTDAVASGFGVSAAVMVAAALLAVALIRRRAATDAEPAAGEEIVAPLA